MKRLAIVVAAALFGAVVVAPVSADEALAKDKGCLACHAVGKKLVGPDYVEIAKKEGGKLVVGGERLKRDTDGFYMAPALFTETTADMRINKEEVFGPVASVTRVKNYDEALAVANATPYGLSAGIATTSLKYARDFKRNSASGLVMVNLPTAGIDYHVPFGGRKKSSYGPREQGSYAKDFYTVIKTAYTA